MLFHARSRPRRSALFLGAAAALLAGSMSACTSSDRETPPAAAADQSSTATTAAEAGGPTAAELCKFLKDEALPTGAKVGSPVGAQAQITIAIFDFYQKKNAVPDNSVIEEQTTATCPDVRAEVLKTAGVDSFQNF